MIGPRYGPDELLPKYVTPMSTYFVGILFPEEPAEIDGSDNEPKIVGDADIIDDFLEVREQLTDSGTVVADLLKPKR